MSDPTTGYISLVRENRNFRNLWYGQIVSLFGDWFNLIASASLVASLTGSGLAVGSLFVVRMLAPFFVSPIAGVAADRYNRKILLIATDLVRVVVVLGFLLVRDREHVWLLYTLTAVQLAMHGVFFPTRNAILPDIVSPRELGAANAISSTTWSVMLATGAAVGGLVSGGFGIYPAFVVDSATFLVSAAFISRMSYQRPSLEDAPKASLTRALEAYVEGLRYLREHLDILVIVLQKASLTLFVAGAYEVIQVELANDVYPIGHGGGISLGIMYAFIGLGSGLGPILARSLTGDRDRPLRIAILVSYAVMAVGLAVIGSLPSFGWVLAGATFRAMGGGTLWVFSNQLLLQSVPPRVRGRVFATEFALLTLAMATSAATGGWALDRAGLGPGDLLRVMSGVVLLPGLLWGGWLWKTRNPRHAHQSPSEGTPGDDFAS
jgi:MFS family permease